LHVAVSEDDWTAVAVGVHSHTLVVSSANELIRNMTLPTLGFSEMGTQRNTIITRPGLLVCHRRAVNQNQRPAVTEVPLPLLSIHRSQSSQRAATAVHRDGKTPAAGPRSAAPATIHIGPRFVAPHPHCFWIRWPPLLRALPCAWRSWRCGRHQLLRQWRPRLPTQKIKPYF
jgi:hypothetical protein